MLTYRLQKLKRLITRLAITEEEKLAKQRNLRRFFRYCNSKLNVSDEIPELILDGKYTARSELLSKLPNRYSTSPDNIPYAFLKRAALGLAKPLTLLFNKFLLLGDCPDIWKTGYGLQGGNEISAGEELRVMLFKTNPDASFSSLNDLSQLF
ncbi:hypothetical protein COOONC_23503 [Cooperia oncophora]